jgi:hypothetical protein
VTIDGAPSDWTGTAPATDHSSTYSNNEFIYRGVVGDVRTDPAAIARPNYDLTEVRVTEDGTYLYFLIRLDDINDTTTDEVHVGIAIDVDMSASDSTPLGFLGDDSGLINGGGAERDWEFAISIHNSTSGTTVIEVYDDDNGNGTDWAAPAGGVEQSFISSSNDVVEARIPLAAFGLTSGSTFGLIVATFDNGSTLDPNAPTWNNLDDTTVDYPDALDGGHAPLTLDALDIMTIDPGSSDPAWDRELSDGAIDPLSYVLVDLTAVPIELSAFELE